MNVRRGVSTILVVLACSALAFCAEGEIRILWRALILSWDLPTTQAQDELRVQASLYTDPSREVQRAIVPPADDGQRHVPDTGLDASPSAGAARLTRSPPSA
jgi:hypothetical protein